MSETIWYRCASCEARYRGRGAALLCCSNRFDDDRDDDTPTGSSLPAQVLGEQGTVETDGGYRRGVDDP